MLVSLLILTIFFGVASGIGFALVYSITSKYPDLPVTHTKYLALFGLSIFAGLLGLLFANFVVLLIFTAFGLETGLLLLNSIDFIGIIFSTSMSDVFGIPTLLTLFLASIFIIAFAEEQIRIAAFAISKSVPAFQVHGKASTLGLAVFFTLTMLSSLWFGFLHLNTPVYFWIATVAGIILSIQITVTDNIMSVILTHGLYDFILFSIALGVL